MENSQDISTPAPVRQNPLPDVPAPLKTLDIRRLRNLSFPKFLGIGAQKAGTSWLWKILTRHPDLFLPGPKEHHYFDRELEIVSPEAYAARFKNNETKIAGEITPAYAVLSEERVKFIHDLMPDARLFFILRNPIDRAWSQALMNLVTQNGRRYEDVPPSDFYAHFDSTHATSRGLYSATIERWENVFSREQLFVDFYEHIQTEPIALLARVMRHVGVRPPADWSGYEVNDVYFEGVKIPVPEAYRDHLRRKFRDEIERLYDRFGEAIASWRVT